MTHLTTAQRVAIRAIHDDPTGEGVDAIRASTIRALINRGIVQVVVGEWMLTRLGERTYQEIMSSGDGPEDLKARLNFTSPGRKR